MPSLLVDLTPLRVSREYRRIWTGLMLANVGTAMTTVAVGLQVWDLTRSNFAVGLLGLVGLVPLVTFGLYGGTLVDAHDRRTVAAVASGGLCLTALGLAAAAAADVRDVWILYALVAVQWAFYAVNNPARSAILPRLLPRELLPSANALQTLVMTAGMSLGPVLAGVLVSRADYSVVYLVEAAGMAVAVWTMARLPKLPPEGDITRPGLRSVVEGLRFIAGRPNIRATFVIDLCAMILAQPRALFPAVGAVVLGGDATTAGVLVAAVASGSFLGALFSGRLGGVRRQGLATCWAVAGWAAGISSFGLVLAAAGEVPADGGTSWWLGPACLALALAGAADSVSAVYRQTILQSATPDALRGRLQGVFIVVVAGGPRLGDAVAGGVADLTSEAWMTIGGGLICLAAVVLLVRLQPSFTRYDAEHPTP